MSRNLKTHVEDLKRNCRGFEKEKVDDLSMNRNKENARELNQQMPKL